MRPQPVRETALMFNNGRRHFRAEVIIASHALIAVHAAANVPTDTGTLTDLQSLNVVACPRRPALPPHAPV